MKIDPDILEILKAGNYKGTNYFLPLGQLDRATYVRVNKCLELLGGKWNKKLKCHVFESSPAGLFEQAVESKNIVDVKKEFQFFETPAAVVDKMLDFVPFDSQKRYLEPSAGRGAICNRILSHIPAKNLTAVELNIDNVKYLEAKFPHLTVIASDFLKLSSKELGLFDIVLMNPPFSKQQEIDHITHSFNLLEDGGKVVSITSNSWTFRDTKKAKDFRELVDDFCIVSIDLPEGTFKESGTNIATKLIVLEKN